MLGSYLILCREVNGCEFCSVPLKIMQILSAISMKKNPKTPQPGCYPETYSDFSLILETKPSFPSLLFLSILYSLSLYPYYIVELTVV